MNCSFCIILLFFKYGLSCTMQLVVIFQDIVDSVHAEPGINKITMPAEGIILPAIPDLFSKFLNLLFIILFHITPEHHCGKVCITDLIAFFYGASKVADAVSKIDPKNHDQYQVHQAQLCCNPAPK